MEVDRQLCAFAINRKKAAVRPGRRIAGKLVEDGDGAVDQRGIQTVGLGVVGDVPGGCGGGDGSQFDGAVTGCCRKQFDVAGGIVSNHNAADGVDDHDALAGKPTGQAARAIQLAVEARGVGAAISARCKVCKHTQPGKRRVIACLKQRAGAVKGDALVGAGREAAGSRIQIRRKDINGAFGISHIIGNDHRHIGRLLAIIGVAAARGQQG